MAWLDLGREVLEEFGSVSVTEHQRGAYDRWRARRTARAREYRREMRQRHDWLIRQVRASERRRVTSTAWAALLSPESVAEARAAQAMTGTGGIKPHRYGRARA